MKARLLGWVVPTQFKARAGFLCLAIAGGCLVASADQVQMQNGDKYLGKVISMNADTIELQSEVLGRVKIPRAKVGVVLFGTNAPAAVRPLTNSAAGVLATASTNMTPELSATLRQLKANTNLVHQVQTQLLGGAGPEANAKFESMMSSLMSGQMTLGDLRGQAQTAANQLRAARKDLGDEAGGLLDSYLAILDQFVAETGPAGGPQTNRAISLPRLKPDSDAGDE